MRSNFERHLARKWKTEGLSYSEISRRLSISRNSAINLCRYNKKRCLKKTGPRQNLTKNMKLSIKRTIEHLQSNFQKINSSKLIAECDLNCSTRTVQSHLKAVGYKYQKIKAEISLSRKQKNDRIDHISRWISENHSWETTIFTDEKRFTLDGPDNWRTYVQKNRKYTHQKRQCKGGSVMGWMMVLPH